MDKRLKNISLDKIQIKDCLWDKYIHLVQEVILPFQWDLINDNVVGAEKSYCIRNFKIAAGLEKGNHQGMVFQDTDVAKWLEAVAFSLAQKKNAKLENLADKAIDLIAAAQCGDGYLNTYYTITGKPRWSNLFEGHELYTAGHMIEAAVAYYESTGKRKLLEVVCRFADYIDQVFGKEEGKMHGYPGHPEVELALVKLYRVTNTRKYLELANYFVRERGSEPCYFSEEDCIKNQNYIFPEFKDFDFDYCQAHLPIEKQETAEGHAVRAVYLYSGMADIAYEYKDEKLLEQCEKLWENITKKRMYVTGSIGSAAYGERFTTDYDLPNDTNYSESCATIGLAMFSNRMFQITKDSKYTDVVEQALYNTLLSGIDMDGKHFFYVNPLEVTPEIAENNPTMRHVKTTRQLWFGVACCPPNIARTLASLGNYIYAAEENSVFVNLFVASQIELELQSGQAKLEMQANYPVSGDISIAVHPAKAEQKFTVAIRKPSFSPQMVVKVNDKEVNYSFEKGYVYLTQEWNAGDVISVKVDVSFRFMHCNPRVRGNIGKVCLMKGPWVYCLEEYDNGKYLSGIRVDTSVPVKEKYEKNLLGGVMCAAFKGEQIDYSNISDALYSNEKPQYCSKELLAIPYCFWNNRGKGEMLVWMNEK